MLDITSRYTGSNELVTNIKNSDIKHPQNIYQLKSRINNVNINVCIYPDLYCEADIE